MRYLSIMLAVTLTMLISSGCSEEQPQAQHSSETMVKKAEGQVKDEGNKPTTSAITAEDKALAHSAEDSHHAPKQTQMMNHKMMEPVHNEIETAAADQDALAEGKMVYEMNCAVCHATGLSGAPKMGDKEAWSDHIHHGIDHMVESAIKGKGAMPAKGGNANLSDREVEAAINYIVEQSR